MSWIIFFTCLVLPACAQQPPEVLLGRAASPTVAPATTAPAPNNPVSSGTQRAMGSPEQAPAAQSRAATARDDGLSDQAIAEQIVRRSRSSYPGSCPFPDNVDRSGRRCGGRSAYSRPGGHSPLCYASDVSACMIAEYRLKIVSAR